MLLFFSLLDKLIIGNFMFALVLQTGPFSVCGSFCPKTAIIYSMFIKGHIFRPTPEIFKLRTTLLSSLVHTASELVLRNGTAKT